MLGTVAAVVVVITLGTDVAAADPGPCVTPRAAVATLLSGLREDRLDLRRAARCTEPTSALTRSEREHAVQTLKAALDAVGARIKVDDIPDATNHIDAKTFEASVILARELPRIRIERMDDGQWMIPAYVLVDADKIYDDAVAIDLHRLQKTFPPWAHAKLLGVAAWQGIGVAILLVLALLVRFIVIRVLLWKSPTILDAFKVSTAKDELIKAARPLGTLVACGVIVLGTPSLSLSGGASSLVFWATRITAAFAALAFAYRAVDVIGEQLTRRATSTPHKMDDHIVALIRRTLKIVVVLLAIVLVLQAFGVNVGSLVAGLGIGGLAVALAAKDTIGNFFGSVAIFLDRPFQVGDWVTAGDVEGTIEHVGFRSTQIRTLRDTVVTVPNAKLADQNLDNWGARKSRHVRWMMGVELTTSADQLEAFADGIRAVLAAHPHTKKEDVDVHLNSLNDGALVFLVQYYVLRPSWSAEQRVKHEVLLDIVRLARDLGVQFHFPTRTLRMADATNANANATNANASANANGATSPEVGALLDVIKAYGPGGKSSRAPGPRILPAPPSEPLPAPTQAAGAPPRAP